MVHVLWTKRPLLGLSRANVPADIPGSRAGILMWTECVVMHYTDAFSTVTFLSN